jgi:hypothetical protein
VEELPEPLGPHSRQRVLDVDAAAQAQDVARFVGTLDPFPAAVFLPILVELVSLSGKDIL